MTLYDSDQLLGGAWLLRESEREALVEQVRALLDIVEREQTALPDWLQIAFEPWLLRTRRWIGDPANAADEERLGEVLDRLRSYRRLIAQFAQRPAGRSR